VTEETMASRGQAAHRPDPKPVKLALGVRAVELVAQALCDGDAADHGTYDWSEADGDLQDDYRRAARHALDAMEDYL
jgi:hypothetical protein